MPKFIRFFSLVFAGLFVVASACDDAEIVTPDTADDPIDEATVDVAPDVESDVELDTVSDAVEDGTHDADAVEDIIPDSQDHEACFEGDAAQMTVADGLAIAFEVNSVVSYVLDIPADAVGTEREVSFGCVDDSIVPEGYESLSEAVEVDFTGRLLDYATVVIPFDTSLFPEGARPSAIRIFLAPRGATRVVSPPVVDMQENMSLGFVTFRTRDAGVYEVGVASEAGETYEREWAFRAITGVSMGCSGAIMVGLRNPDEFDIIGALGGPTDWTYLAHYIRDGGLGGFTPAPTYGSADMFTPTEEFEHAMAFDEFWSPTGDGTGGSFDRGEYLSILQDLSLSFGNTASYSTASPLLPPGVPASELLRSRDERCPGTAETVLTIETGFFDDEYNPNGDQPVIMFCDGTANNHIDTEFERNCDIDDDGVPDGPNRGLYPGPDNQHDPAIISWAVDVNGNGRRDFGEPVIRNNSEPFEDIGADGLADADETDYDAVDNPDPSGDNYDYFNNPNGTEGNWLFDEGEPYDDVGLDGVADTPQIDEGGYDYGEGNGAFDYNPHLAALYEERDPHHIVHDLTDDEWDHLNIYMDAGIRDLFNFAVSTNHLVGQLQARGENVRIYDGFHALDNLDPELDDYLFHLVDYENLGEHVYLRYGNPDATWEEVCWGDGKHVGTTQQIINRLLTLLGFITNRFPGGDYTLLEPPYPTPNGNYRFYSEALGASDQYTIVLPPGHERTLCSDTDDNDDDGLIDGRDGGCEHGMDNSEGEGMGEPYCSDGIDNDNDGDADYPDDDGCASADDVSEWPDGHPLRDAVFPVIYLLHGYGQTPEDLRATVALISSYMVNGVWQKAIVVYPDGFCGDNDINQCNDGIDNDEDEAVDGDDPDCATSGGRGEDGVSHPLCSDGVDNDGDGLIDDLDGGCVSATADDESDCVKGNFYTNHMSWPDGSTPGPPFEDGLLDLVDHIDAVYRTRAPGTHTETR